MKKQILFSIAVVFAVGFIKAQTLSPIGVPKTGLKLTKQTKQTINTKVSAEGQDMSTRSDNTLTMSYDISALTEQGGNAEIKITAMKISSESDGGEASYDSQTPEEGDSRIGDVVKERMKTPVKITLDAKGLITTIKGHEKMEAAASKNPEGSGFKKGEQLDVFFKLDKSVKPGDVWTTKIDTKESKITNDYTYKSFENGMATIELISDVKLDQKMEQMGMTVYSKMEGKIVATIIVDVSTLVIKSKTTTTVLNGNIDAQGQTAPISVFSTGSETVN